MKKTLLILFLLLPLAIMQAQQDRTDINAIVQSTPINVSIGGDFIVVGTFPSLFDERLDRFLTRVYIDAKRRPAAAANEEENVAAYKEAFRDVAWRDIRILSADGATMTVDLEKYRVNGDLKENPVLKENDVVLFRPLDLDRYFFQLGEGFNRPGKYQFVEGDDLQDALELGMGLSGAYDGVSEIEIIRLSYDGTEMERLLAGVDDDIPLKPGDRLRVAVNETQRKDFTTTVLGEVGRPGEIPVTKGATPLRDLLGLAGGTTGKAALDRIIIYRTDFFPGDYFEREYDIEFNEDPFAAEQRYQTLRILERIEGMELYRMSSLDEIDTTYFFLETRLQNYTNWRTIVNLAGDSTHNAAGGYMVSQGDLVVVPRKEQIVQVFGQVRYPGAVPFKAGRGYQWYLDRAGGAGELAEEEVYIIRGQSKEWIVAEDFEERMAELRPGDYIYVSKEPQRSYLYDVGVASRFLSVVGSIATIILLLINLGG